MHKTATATFNWNIKNHQPRYMDSRTNCNSMHDNPPKKKIFNATIHNSALLISIGSALVTLPLYTDTWILYATREKFSIFKSDYNQTMMKHIVISFKISFRWIYQLPTRKIAKAKFKKRNLTICHWTTRKQKYSRLWINQKKTVLFLLV